METTEVIGIGRSDLDRHICSGPGADYCTVSGADYWRISSGRIHPGNDAELYPQIGGFGASLLIFGDWQLTVLSDMFISIFNMIPQIFTR